MNTKTDTTAVILVAMPFVSLYYPSPALSALAASVRDVGISIRCLYPGFYFAEKIGIQNYSVISESSAAGLIGEWLFSRVAFPECANNDDIYLSNVLQEIPRSSRISLRSIRNKTVAYIDEVAQDIIDQNPSIVACSSVFSQNCASLALLRRIRELSPKIVTVMGGANCEGDMGAELHRRYQWVDYLFSGESDHIFPELCHRILNGKSIVSSGYRLSSSIRAPEDRLLSTVLPPLTSERIYDMTTLPHADFDDYFIALGKSLLKKKIIPVLMMETSRGCWWGEVTPCSFCGLSGSSHKYRVKDAQRAYNEIIGAARKYGISTVKFTDNCLCMEYFDTLLPMLSKENLNIFYEIRPNITYEQCITLSKAGVSHLQSGIESLHDGSLKLLNKGHTAFHNVRFLKRARKHGMYVDWNYLIDIPGEKHKWYDEVSKLIPLLYHLNPPGTCNPVVYQRFSCYHKNPQDFGLKLEAWPVYNFIYPPGEDDDYFDNSQIAYHFVDVSSNKLYEASLKKSRLLDRIKEWRKYFNESEQQSLEPALSYKRNGLGKLVIIDSRLAADAKEHRLDGLEAEVFEMCDDGATYVQLTKAFCETSFGISEQKLDEILSYLIGIKLMIKLSGFYLNLAVSLPTKQLSSF